jgi:hypothetical protein
MVWQGYEANDADMGAKEDSLEAEMLAGVHKRSEITHEAGRAAVKLSFQHTIQWLNAHQLAPAQVQEV